MITTGYPLCAACMRPVESISTLHDVRDGSLVVTVSCHGQEETARLSESDQMNMNGMVLRPAFAGRTMTRPHVRGSRR